MSYCVKCGVELDASAKKCALCSTPVINPDVTTQAAEEELPFSENLMLPDGIKKKFIAFVVSVTMAIPNIVMVFLNVFFIKQGFWSIYVAAASCLLWVLFVLPFLVMKKHPYLMWLADTVAVTGFSFIVLGLGNNDIVVLKSILSIIPLVSLSVLFLIIWLRKKKHHWTSVLAVILSEITVVSFLGGLFVSNFSGIFNFLVVGIVISLCSLVLMVFFIYCSKSKSIRAWLNKAFYV